MIVHFFNCSIGWLIWSLILFLFFDLSYEVFGSLVFVGIMLCALGIFEYDYKVNNLRREGGGR